MNGAESPDRPICHVPVADVCIEGFISVCPLYDSFGRYSSSVIMGRVFVVNGFHVVKVKRLQIDRSTVLYYKIEKGQV